jgi:hypothetical protein
VGRQPLLAHCDVVAGDIVHAVIVLLEGRVQGEGVIQSLDERAAGPPRSKARARSAG